MYLHVLIVMTQANSNPIMRSLMATFCVVNSLCCEMSLPEEKLEICIETYGTGLKENLCMLKADRMIHG